MRMPFRFAPKNKYREISFDPFILKAIADNQGLTDAPNNLYSLPDRENKHRQIQDVWNVAKKILSTRQLQCFYLKVYCRKNEREIADMLGFEQPLVNVSFRCALQKLREHCKSYLDDGVKKFLDSKKITTNTYFRFNLGYIDSYGNIFSDTSFHEYILSYKGSKFRNCILIPVYDIFDNLVGISSRNLDMGKPKYDGTVYDKGSYLFGLNYSWKKILRKDEAVLVEGQFDMIKMYQKGHRNTVAICGSELTKKQLCTILKFTRNLTLMLDGDDAGYSKMSKIYENYKEYANIRFIILPEKEDPDTYVDKGITLKRVTYNDLLQERLKGEQVRLFQ